jgi:hypothetical protein
MLCAPRWIPGWYGCRVLKLKGGMWVELDEPQVIAYKNERLPASNCKNELHRIPIDFSTDALAEKLSSFSNRTPVVVVIEGVFIYLEEEVIRQLLQILHRLFPQHKLICDLTSRQFFEEYSGAMHEKITGIGASFKFTADAPEEIFLENGYRCIERVSIIEKAVEFKSIQIPRIALETFLRPLASGYAIYVFEAC